MNRLPILSGYLSVRWKLIVPYLLIAGLVFAVLAPVTSRIVSERVEEEADHRLTQTANSVAVLLEQSQQQSVLSTNFVAGLPEMIESEGDTTVIRGIVNRRRVELDFRELSFYAPTCEPDARATVYGGPSSGSRAQASQEAERVRSELILATCDTHESQHALVFTPDVSQIMVAAPILSGEGDFQGIIVAVRLINNEFMADIGDVVNANVLLVESNAVIASTVEDRASYEDLIRDGFLDDVADRPSRNIDFEGDTQQRILASPLVIDGVERGVVMVTQPIESLKAIQDDVQTAIFTLALVVVIASLLLGVFSYFNFARPLLRLADATNKVSAGNLNERVDIRVPKFMMEDELTALGDNFNSMTDHLRDLYAGLERKVAERTQELNKANEDLALARDEALEANRTKSAFMANMSHELRTPLNAIIGYSNLLVTGTYGETTEKQNDRLVRILDSGKHLLALINDVLDLSKIEAGKMELYLEAFDVSELLDNVTETASSLMDKNRNELRREQPPDLGEMFSDVTKVRQILFNLISNAAKFTEDGSVTLSISDEIHDDVTGIRFDVTDTGIGMSDQQQANIFREFVQADASTTRKYGGTGLGLTITRRFCEMMGGSITVTSEVGEGSTFSVWLPRKTHPPKFGPSGKKKVETGTHAQVETTKPVVLIIDDDEAALETIQHYLTEDNFHVMTTNSGADGIRIAKEHQPDVIMLDVLMPSMDGWAVLSKLKADEDTANIPVIMSTIVSDRNMGFALGATDYVTKPVDRDQMLRIVNKYRCASESCPVLIVEDDDTSRQVMRDMLEERGWQVLEAVNGVKGLDVLSHTRPDVILLDLMMPEMNGFEFLRRLRTNEEWADIPVVVITAMDLSPQHHEELMQSVQQIILKGDYKPEDILKEVRHWTRMTQKA